MLKQSLRFLLLSLVAGLITACVSTNRKVNGRNSAAMMSDAIMKELGHSYPGITATVYDGENVVWSFASGYSDVEAKTPVTSDTKFNIYSTSKALTGLAFARLEQNNDISRKQNMGEIISDLPSQLNAITIEQLLSHTSGIRHYKSSSDWLEFAKTPCQTPHEAVNYFSSDPLEFAPGSEEQYSTFAFVLASAALVKVTNSQDFVTALNTSLGDWANFELDNSEAQKSTSYIPVGILPEGLRPEHYTGLADDEIVPWLPLSAKCKYGGGGIIASSRQLARAGAALYEGLIIPKDHLKDIIEPWSSVSNVIYGGALSINKTSSGTLTSFELSGGAPGGRSYLYVMIEREISVAITGNLDGPDISSASREIANLWDN
jgi:CubicO group peptidase (beta-lactamase class C family)